MNRIHRLALVNGINMVKVKVIEELNELIVAIEGNVIEEIIDEIADVRIVISQLIHLHQIEDEISTRESYKIERTEKLLGIWEERE